ncbi:[Fe-Fe] hydrogenase large subunit C-terminal domain-containing protein [Faecalicatena orotica]|uniref:[Fe-Fe] hydrogenase large subunit C-terminal domain-containing protein n=1 Tax=Faecalicatena orotica TaxID=1544 RepID=UPI003216BEA5
MKTFDELYRDILAQKVSLKAPLPPEYEPYHLDCLLHPERNAPVLFDEPCTDCAYERACQNSCIFDAIEEGSDGKLFINPNLCTGCGVCIDACENHNISAGKDILPAMKAVREAKGPAYMMVAPAFLGQFTENVTPGKLRTAFRALGFSGMVEVALFADILTLKEALEFDKHILEKGDYQLTSCCCPVWIAMIRKMYKELMPHVPGAVSPMVACGRMIKLLHPDAVTVFAGPCLAKKSEAREKDVAGAVDYVLTFQEVQDIFEAADIHPEELEDQEKEHSSRTGRIYARTGGVSEAVRETERQLRPDRKIKVKAEQADGIQDCRVLISRIQNQETDANFFEGMGCPGGCVGGPKAILNKNEGKRFVDEYGDQALFATPLENPYVMKMLEKLGFTTVEDFVENSELLVRDFS